jgi:hypothetical protein
MKKDPHREVINKKDISYELVGWTAKVRGSRLALKYEKR